MTQVLKPGILVSAKTAISGGVSYERRDLDTGEVIELNEGADVARWETTRVITDPDEHERAVKVRGKAGSLIRGQCSASSFGLLCPVGNEEGLDAAIDEARRMAEEFNRGAEHTSVTVNVLKGRIAETDEEATRAIADEIAGLLGEMEAGVKNLDVKSVREAASRAKKLEPMLVEKQKSEVDRAVSQARKNAREIVKRVEKNGEKANEVLRDLWTGPIETARFAFLEIASAEPAEREDEKSEALPQVDVRRFGGLDTATVTEGA